MDMFFSRLKDLRTERGYTQKQLADAIQTTADSIYSWEKGRSQPSIETLCKLADFFDCSIDYLTGREDDFGSVSINAAANFGKTPKEKELLAVFNSLGDEYQAQVLEYARYFGDRAAKKRKN